MVSPNVHVSFPNHVQVESENLSTSYFHVANSLQKPSHFTTTKDPTTITPSKRTQQRLPSKTESPNSNTFTTISHLHSSSFEDTTTSTTPTNHSFEDSAKTNAHSIPQEGSRESTSSPPQSSEPLMDLSGSCRKRRKGTGDLNHHHHEDVLEIFPMRQIPNGPLLDPVHMTRLAKLPPKFGGGIFNIKIISKRSDKMDHSMRTNQHLEFDKLVDDFVMNYEMRQIMMDGGRSSMSSLVNSVCEEYPTKMICQSVQAAVRCVSDSPLGFYSVAKTSPVTKDGKNDPPRRQPSRRKRKPTHRS
eukprot:g7399.t1